MNDVTLRLNALKKKIEDGKAAKAKAEANLEMFTKQREELEMQIRELGVEPGQLNDEIAKLDRQIAEALYQAEQLIEGPKPSPDAR